MANKRGVVIAAVALVAVLLVAGVGYGALSSRQAAANESDVVVQGDPSNDEPSDDASSDDEPDGDALLLADYDATVYDEAGAPVSLTAIAGGKPLVINFWATWCPYCVQEMPDFLDIVREYGDAVSFAFVDATDGRRETKEMAETWLADNGFTELPAYYDSDSDAVATFGVGAFPTTIVVDGTGKIVAASPGAIDAGLMREALDKLV